MYVINDDIKSSNLKGVYVLTGKEDYLIAQFKNKLLKALTGKNSVRNLQGDMNFAYFHGKETDLVSVRDFAETLPFLSERRVVLIEDADIFNSSGEYLANYLPNKPDTTYFVIVDHNVDKRSKLYKTTDSLGHVAEFKEQNEETLKKWIVGVVHGQNKNITNGALDELLKRVGFDMKLLETELEKLFCYCLEKDAIEKSDVEALTSVQIGDHVFDMIEAMGNKDRQKALDLYYQLLELKVAPMKTLSLLGRQFSILYSVKELRQKGFDKNKIAEKMDMKPFFMGKYLTQAGKFTLSQLKEAINDCAEYDEMIKKGNMVDQMCVELLLIKYSMPTD